MGLCLGLAKQTRDADLELGVVMPRSGTPPGGSIRQRMAQPPGALISIDSGDGAD